MATQYMSLDLPVVSVTLGPAWAASLNAALSLVDSHDHSPGKGALITPAGMLINADVDYNNYNAYDLRSARLIGHAAALNVATDIRCIYAVGGNLYYNNEAGVAVQITSGSSVNSSGSGAWGITAPGAYPYAVVSGDAQRVITVATSGAARTIELPAATTAMYCIIKDSEGAAQTNNITVTPDGTDTIDGDAADYIINENFGARGFISDGVSAWYVV